MIFQLNIPITRKATKGGYYYIMPGGARVFCVRKADAIKKLKADMAYAAENTSIVTVADYAAKRKGSRPPYRGL